MSDTLKAWACKVPSVHPDIVVIHSAETRGKAQYGCLRQVRDAGYPANYMDVDVKRAPEFDGTTRFNGRSPEIARKMMESDR